MTTRRTTTISMLTIAAFTLAACGGAKENAIEELIERETGEEIDLDLDSDGGFSVETEDGSISFDVDEDGSFTIEGPEGEVITGDADGDGNIDIDTGDDNVTIDADDDGSFTIESEDGTIISGAGTELPDDWPLPNPDGLTISGSQRFAGDGELIVSVIGTVADGPAWAEAYAAQIAAAGFTESSTFTSEGNVLISLEKGDFAESVSISAFEGSDGWDVSLGYAKQDG
ncbi:MAG: hypothetical protein AAFP84_21740 [Actinomycetota bacterium]